MNIDTAPQIEDEERECPNCGEDGTFVRYDGDTVCSECHYTSTPSNRISDREPQWSWWWKHRRDEYSGWYGDERVRMVGGFYSAWDYDDF
jgi:ribosomal protein S27AE